jgi:hypothetical protein
VQGTKPRRPCTLRKNDVEASHRALQPARFTQILRAQVVTRLVKGGGLPHPAARSAPWQNATSSSDVRGAPRGLSNALLGLCTAPGDVFFVADLRICRPTHNETTSARGLESEALAEKGAPPPASEPAAAHGIGRPWQLIRRTEPRSPSSNAAVVEAYGYYFFHGAGRQREPAGRKKATCRRSTSNVGVVHAMDRPLLTTP